MWQDGKLDRTDSPSFVGVVVALLRLQDGFFDKRRNHAYSNAHALAGSPLAATSNVNVYRSTFLDICASHPLSMHALAFGSVITRKVCNFVGEDQSTFERWISSI